MEKQLAYAEAGKGNTVIFMHGFCETKAIWKNFIDFFSPNYRAIAIDLGGFGDSHDLLPEKTTIENLAEQVEKLLASLEIKKCTIIAHSLGGYVSLALAEKHPTIVNGLCLFHSSALPDTEGKKKSRNKTIEFIEKNGIEAFIENFVPSLFTTENRKKNKQVIEWLKEIGNSTPKKTALEVIKAMRDRNSTLQVLKQADFPINFIIGKKDEAIPLEAYQEQVFLPKKSCIYAYENMGHMGMFENEKDTLSVVNIFLEICWNN